ncbi:MAG: hypothetical protein FK730_07190 [Asgard group archaeon]|nr:hypothetical protein [Asgard group archaeon]
MDSKRLKKSLFIALVAMVVVVWNVGCYNLIAVKGVNLFGPSNNPISDDPSNNIDSIIDPPLGNSTTLPQFTTLFTLMAFNLPMEILIIFLAEIVVGSILRVEKQRMTFLRLLLLLGSALLLTIGNSVIHYVAVWPAMHDWPIHRGLTFNETITYEIIPQYGGAEVFFSKGVGVLLFLVSMIVIVGMHFPVFKYLLKYKNLQSGISLLVPFLNYFIVWLLLSRQITENLFGERTGKTFYLTIIFSGGFILLTLFLLLWNLTLTTKLQKQAKKAQAEQQQF